jgi:hypothetical protein
MAIKPPDRLLWMTRLILVGTMGLAALVAIALIVLMPFLWFGSAEMLVDSHHVGPEATAAIGVILIAVLGVVVLAFFFLRQLVAVIDSVGVGSPFVPANVRRLRTMGWLVLVMEGLSFLGEPLQDWARSVLAPDVDIDVSFSFGWLITGLLLFILARVFEQGTRLAEDVEGTV